ncbi:flagellar hook-length control protein FliK [Shewanella sp. 11B5]|uniref:flagellar hook-length control protein FliK n=1 Tax=Shewanella sp. 11B5 TaxID=2058298 RepID=UPI000C79D31B|nr:flagellar hook-length control protein FliK [Shewanella sp. 11B5]PKI06868.1 flagellar hook-length control protein FliK [Shewanella sp. 11B5]
MAVPTTLPQKPVNTVTIKPVDVSPQAVIERKQTQTDSTSLPAKISNEKSVVSNSSTTKSDLAAVLLPVKVVQPPASAQLDISIANQQYQLNKTAELQKLLQQTAQVVIASDQAKLVARAVSSVNLPVAQAEVINSQSTSPAIPTASAGSTATAPAQTVATQLVLLAQPIQLALPQGLEELAKQNGVSTQQLASLAARVQGYPLPTAIIDQGKLTFSGGTSIQLSPNTALNSGQYLAKVVVQHQQLQLTLTPVIAEISVNLTKLPAPPQAAQTLESANIIITKNEPAQILSQFLKKLESTPLPIIDNAVKGSDAQQKTPNELTPSSAKVGQDSTAVKTLTPVTQQQSSSGLSAESNLAKTGSNMEQQANLAKSAVNNTVEQTALPTKSVAEQNTPKANTTSAIDNSAKNNPPNNPASNKMNSDSDPAPIEVLNKALSKAGAMPIKQQLSQQIPHNLASELFKHLPQISPHPLSALSDPALLSSELYSLAALNLAHTQLGHSTSAQPSPLFSGSAITTLFQLLLGVKTKSTGSGISDKLQAHLAQLQQRTLSKLSANSGLLAALDKLGGADSLAQLANSIALYQHASTDPNQAMTWYFALPYSINQRDEQFEGKFEQENDSDKDKKAGWKLQLKFNLAQGSLLICAHKQADVLDIQFKGNNQMLLAKVERFNQALSDKITQIGFTPGKLTTQLAQIPATLLPGDHYLVKTRA